MTTSMNQQDAPATMSFPPPPPAPPAYGPPGAAPPPPPFGAPSGPPPGPGAAWPGSPPAPPVGGLNRRDAKILEIAQPLLPPWARVRQIVVAETVHPVLAFCLGLLVIPGLLLFATVNHNRVLAVADEGIYLLDCGHTGFRSKRLMMVLPRGVELTMKLRVGKEKLYVGGRWRKSVAAANADLPRILATAPPAAGVTPAAA